MRAKRILIVHSEGNVNTNPHLSGLTEILCEQGYEVDIASPRRGGFAQKPPCAGSRLILVDSPPAAVAGELVLLAGADLSSGEALRQAIVQRTGSYDLVIGVDRAIVEASIIARLRGIPLGLISYEIFFADETSVDYKRPEIAACERVDFAICPDAVRAEHLCRENRIAPEKILLMPVAGRGARPRRKSFALHDRLGIGRDKKIVLYSGCVAEFCLTEPLIRGAMHWPDEWVLVIHNRYGLDGKTRPLYERYGAGGKVYFSCEPVETPEEMHRLMDSADLGVALYQPTAGDKWTGKNIQYIGLSSGKIATYLQHGVPVLVNEIGAMSDFVRSEGLGAVVREEEGFAFHCTPEDLEAWSVNAQRFFADTLDLNRTAGPLLERLRSLTAGRAETTPRSSGYRVSAIVSTYNSETLIEGCLQDLVEQTLYGRGELEIVVVNSGSEQNEEAIVRRFQKRYPHIQYIRTEQREGIYAAWNRGIRACRGRYVTNANTDDRHSPQMLEKQAAALDAHSQVAAVYSFYYATATPNQTWQTKTPTEVRTWHPEYSREQLLLGNFMGPFPMWRRSVHEEYGYFDESLKVAGDYEFFLRISQTHPFLRIPELLGLYLNNPNSLERSAGTRDAEDQWVKRLYTENAGRLIRRPLDPAKDAAFEMPQSETGLNAAIDLFETAQRTFAEGSLVSAREWMRQYQAAMNYEWLPRTDRRTAGRTPKMSVVIVTYHRTEDLVKLLERLGRQTFTDFETIVVDNGGTDLSQVRGRCDVTVECPTNFNLSEGRNIGVHFARGRICVFLDDDALVDDDYTAAMFKAFESYAVLGLRGRTVPKTATGEAMASFGNQGDMPFLTMCDQEGNSAFLRSAWQAVGGQDPLLFGHEGTDLTWRLMQAYGRRDVVLYWPAAKIYHDYGDAKKIRKKQLHYKRVHEYLAYKYGTSISGLHAELKKLPLPEGPTCEPAQPAEAARWRSLCWREPRRRSGGAEPKVTVVIACQNTAQYLPECLESIRAQTMTEWETILVDDGSRDQTPEVLEHYARLDGRFKVYLFNDCQGPYVRRNYAIARAAAPYICIQDADDIMAPHKLQTLLDEMGRDERLGVVGSFYGRFMDTFRGPAFCDRICMNVAHDDLMKEFARAWYVCWHASALIRKSLFETIGPFDAHPWGSDTMWLNKAAFYSLLTGRARFRVLPEQLTFKREHDKSQTGTILCNHPRSRRKLHMQHGMKQMLQVYERVRNNPSLPAADLLRACHCNDFVARFGHSFEQWEAEPATREMKMGLMAKSAGEFLNRFFVDSLISMNSLCGLFGDVETQVRGVNLLRGLCRYAGGQDDLARQLLRREIDDHGTMQARRFLALYLEDGQAEPDGKRRRENVEAFVFDYPVITDAREEVVYDNAGGARPTVSVLMDCREREVDLVGLLTDWNRQPRDAFELVIVTRDNRAADFEPLGHVPMNLRVINTQEPLSRAEAYNMALRHSGGEITAFVPPAVRVEEDFIEELINAMRTHRVSGVRGRIRGLDPERLAHEHDLGSEPLYCALDTETICAFRREVIEQAGGLQAGMLGYEMTSLSWAVYNAGKGSEGPILYLPSLCGTLREPLASDYLLGILGREQLWWHLSRPEFYSTFIRFAESRYSLGAELNNEPETVSLIGDYLSKRCPEAALEWARRACQLKPDSLDNRFALAVCEFEAGEKAAGAALLEDLLRRPFAAAVEGGRTFNAQERIQYAEAARCTCVCRLKLAEYAASRGQADQAGQMLEKLLANPNIPADLPERQEAYQLLEQLKAGYCKGRRPRVSVIIPAYNAAEYIRGAVESVLAQTVGDFELIIINDGSTDNTEQIVKAFRDPRIRYLCQPNAGLPATHNRGIRQARGEFVIKLDHDDLMTPDYIAQHLAAFDRHPEADLVYCDDLLMDEQCKPIRVIARKEYERTEHLVRDLFQGGFPVIPFRTCIRKSVFDRIGYFDESLNTGEDYDMLRRFVQQGLIARHLPGAFYLRRLTEVSHSRNTSLSKAQTHFKVMKRYLETFSAEQLFPDVQWTQIPPRQKEFFLAYMAARVFAAVGEQYEKTKSSVHLVRTAFECAAEQLRQCQAAFPEQQAVVEMLDKCRRYLATPETAGPQAPSVPVTIIMAGYNARATVEAAVQSVLAQTWRDFELVFVDDGSTDGTAQAVEAFGDRRIRLLRQAHKNFAAAMNQGIRAAEGEFVISVDADDMIETDYLEKLMAFARQHPGYDYYYPAALALTDAHGRLTGEEWEYPDFDDSRLVPEFLFKYAFSPIPNAGSLKRRAMFEQTGLFRELDNAEDFDFLARNALNIRFKRAARVCGYRYRMTPTANTARYVQRNRVTLEVLQDMLRRYPAQILLPELGQVSEAQRPGLFRQRLIEIFERHAEYYGKDGLVFLECALQLRRQFGMIAQKKTEKV